MGHRHERFDAEEFTARKNDFMGYRFCPWCRTELSRGEIDGRTRVYCSQATCGFIYYQNPVPAAGALIIQDGKILLVKRAHPPRIGWWCLPAGFMEWQEHPEETAVREVREETGLDITLKSFFQVYVGQDDPRTNAVLMLYLADATGGTLAANDDAQEVRFFFFDDLPEQIAFESHRRALQDYVRRFGA